MRFPLPPGVEDLLPRVEKPARYIGGERNSTPKPDAALRFALAFPDAYEIGMSHLGFRILYAILNAHPDVAAERVFAPWPDMEAELRSRGLPLWTLETHRPVGECDIVGFSLQYELAHTNILTMLDLAGIPLRSADRTEDHPIVIGGGPIALHPEPVADFFDCFLLGDGEELALEFALRALALKKDGAPRETKLRELAKIEGVYVPLLYTRRPSPDGRFELVAPPAGDSRIPYPVRRRFVTDLDAFPFPRDVVVPYTEIVHNRVTVEIMRGCNAGCRFCQAGYLYRPERYRAPSRVLAAVEESVRSTGFEEASLTSLNSGEYPAIEPLLAAITARFEGTTTGVSLSSLRADSLTDAMAAEIARVKRTGITMAPEAGTQRMRDRIGKGITEEDIVRGAEIAFRNGWDLIKLYFMIGLPGEEDADVEEIGRLALRLLDCGRRHRGGRAQIHLAVSNFIPKPWTPFQWEAMDRPQDLQRKQQIVSRAVRKSPVKRKWHDPKGSLLESVLGRGDRRLGAVIEAAWRRGCRFDGWGERVRFDDWTAAFEECGVDPIAEASRPLDVAAPLPWDHVDGLVTKGYLRAELQASRDGRPSGACGTENCAGCGSFAPSCIAGITSNRAGLANDLEPLAPAPSPPAGPVSTYRASYRKTGLLRFISHLDLVRTITYAFRRAGLPVAMSEGFSPHPRFSFGPALPVGVEGQDEVLDFSLTDPLEPGDILDRINRELPPELHFNGVRRRTAEIPALGEAVGVALWSAELPLTSIDGDAPLDRRIADLLATTSLPWERERGKGERRVIDLRPAIADIRWTGPPERLLLYLRLGPGPQARPEEVLHLLLGDGASGARIARERLLRATPGGLRSPLPPVRHTGFHVERHRH